MHSAQSRREANRLLSNAVKTIFATRDQFQSAQAQWSGDMRLQTAPRAQPLDTGRARGRREENRIGVSTDRLKPF
jgi:hypothetical protein